MQLSLQKRDEEVATKAAEIERLKAMTTLSRGDLSRVLSEDHGGGGNGGAPDKAALRNAFNMIDADGGGTLDRDEVGQLSEKLGRKLTDKELDEMMAKMDSDGSGAVEFEEFATYFSVPEPEPEPEAKKTDWAATIAAEEEAAALAEPEPELEPAPAPSPRKQLRRRGGACGGMGASGMRASRNLDID